ncbi:hypothetical protein GR11A_00226 [Vibrio phage vB_VcorM_GR11A]|nr:hypothetical protein GR11A_00226 [Vibrio phage vB_VcorM_GR11A]
MNEGQKLVNQLEESSANHYKRVVGRRNKCLAYVITGFLCPLIPFAVSFWCWATSTGNYKGALIALPPALVMMALNLRFLPTYRAYKSQVKQLEKDGYGPKGKNRHG